MSFKDWKNKELNENLNKKWGFKMDLSKLSEGIGAGPSDPMGGQVAWENEPPMSQEEVGLGTCIEEKIAQGMDGCAAEAACKEEMAAMDAVPVGGEMERDVPFQEGKGELDEASAMSAGAAQGHVGHKRRTK